MKTTPQIHARTASLPRMTREEESESVIQYRGRLLEVSFVLDEDDTTPGDEGHELPVSAAQAASWKLGEWWYHGVLVCALDAEGEWLELPHIDCNRSYSRMPSFMDHDELIYKLCDSLCDELDVHGVSLTAK